MLFQRGHTTIPNTKFKPVKKLLNQRVFRLFTPVEHIYEYKQLQN